MLQLTTAICLAALSQSPGLSNLGYYRQPNLHGDTLVFVSQGDIWSVPVTGGLAHELTSHVAPASDPHISPDGQSVAFSAAYDGPRDAYVMPLAGGMPTRLTYSDSVGVSGWTPDGRVITSTAWHPGLRGPQLVLLEPRTLAREDVPLADANDGCCEPSGATIFFTRFAFQGSHTKRYKGGTAQSIWKYTRGATEAIPLTAKFEGTSKSPAWWSHRIYFLSDRDGVMNVWSMDENGGSLKQQTHSVSWDVQSVTVDSGRVVYQLGADLHVLNLADGADHVIPIELASDFDASREHWIKNPAPYVTALDASSDGDRIAVTARGQVFAIPTEPGRIVEATRKRGVRYRHAMFMPDGKTIVALSDESGENEWWQFPANGLGIAKKLTSGSKTLAMTAAVSPDGKLIAYADKNFDLWLLDMATDKVTKIYNCPDGQPDDLKWSPDSRWLAFSFPTMTFDRLALYSAATGKVTPITTARADSEAPAWSPDGKWLYFISERTFQSTVKAPWGSRAPEPFFDKQSKIYALGLVKGLRSPFQPNDELFQPPKAKPVEPNSGPVPIDLDGLAERLWEIPIPAGNYSLLAVNGERLFFLSSVEGGPATLESVAIANENIALKPLASGVTGFGLTRDGKKLIVSVAGGFKTMPASAPGPGAEKPIDLSGWSFSINPREEWRQMFVDAWRMERDYFYDPNMHGVNWPAILKKYSPLVDRVRDRSELSDLLAQMVGELSALHTFVYGGDVRSASDAVAPASLGAELTRDAAAGGYRVDRIYSGEADYPDSMAPLARPDVHVKVGDVITAINGVDTLSVPDAAVLLRAQAGHQVLIHVRNGRGGGERDAVVVPIGTGAMANLIETDWEEGRRQLVESQSSDKIGYVHLRAMSSGDIDQWERDFYPVFDRQGLIIDVRHNGGGNIDSWIIERLLRKAWFYWQDRVGRPSWNMQRAFRGYVVVLCDENTASDGEAFTEGIKRLGLGKVVGTRTWGGEIWLSSDNVLEDRGIATAAETGVYGPEGKWLIEGHGVDPDVVVDNLPHATYDGGDAQLQAALGILEREIAAKPIPIPPAPKRPDKSFPPSQKSGA